MQKRKTAHITLATLVVGIVAFGVLAGVMSNESDASGTTIPALRPGQPVALNALSSQHVERAYLLGTSDGQAIYRVKVRGQGLCFGAGPDDKIGSIGEFECGYDGFPTEDRPVVYGAVVGADGPGRVLSDADFRLYRLNVIAAEGVAAIKVAGRTVTVRDNIASVSFDEGAVLGIVAALSPSGEVVDTYDLRPQK